MSPALNVYMWLNKGIILTPEEEIVLSASAIRLSPEAESRMAMLWQQVNDWNGLLEIAGKRGLAPLLYAKLYCATTPVPADMELKLRQYYLKTLSRSVALQSEFGRIAALCTSRNIEIIPLKGAYLSGVLYGDVGLRQMSDIDILVKDDKAAECIRLLREDGYQPVESKGISEFVDSSSDFVHYPPLYKNGFSVEVHRKLHLDAENYDLSLNDIWQESGMETVCEQQVRVLSPYMMLMHLCIHLDKHFKKGQVQFSSFTDIYNLMLKYADGFRWQEFAQTCEKYGCEHEVFRYLLLVNRFYNASLPGFLVDKYGGYCTSDDEMLFITYLRGYRKENANASAVPVHLKNLKTHGLSAVSLRYLFEIIFPSKTFMIQKYGLAESEKVRKLESNKVRKLESNKVGKLESRRSEEEKEDTQNSELRTTNFKLLTFNFKLKFWWLWYPYRWWVGVKGVINSLRS